MDEEKPNGHTPLDTDPVPLRTEAPPNNAPAANEHDGIRQDLSEFERVSADIQRKNLVATRFIAVVTALYMWFAALQWWTMRNQLKEMRGGSGDTHALAVAAGDQAKGVQDLATVTKRAYQIANRPSIVAYAALSANKGELPNLYVELVNSGNAPAINVVIVPGNIGVDVSYRDPTAKTLTFRATTRAISSGFVVLAPNHGREERDLPKSFGLVIDPRETTRIPIGNWQMDCVDGIPAEWLDGARRNPEGVSIFITHGTVRYEDLFGGTYTISIDSHMSRPSDVLVLRRMVANQQAKLCCRRAAESDANRTSANPTTIASASASPKATKPDSAVTGRQASGQLRTLPSASVTCAPVTTSARRWVRYSWRTLLNRNGNRGQVDRLGPSFTCIDACWVGRGAYR